MGQARRKGQGEVKHVLQIVLWIVYLLGGCKSRLRKLRPVLGICHESAVAPTLALPMKGR